MGTGSGPSNAIAIDGIPFSTSGDSTGFASKVSLGTGPDVFFKYMGTQVRREGKSWQMIKEREVLELT